MHYGHGAGTEQREGSRDDGPHGRHLDRVNDNVSRNSLTADLTKMYNDLNVRNENFHVHSSDDIDNLNVQNGFFYVQSINAIDN